MLVAMAARWSSSRGLNVLVELLPCSIGRILTVVMEEESTGTEPYWEILQQIALIAVPFNN